MSILEDVLIPFLAKAFQGQKYRLMQDNNTKHTSRVEKAFSKEKESIGGQPQPVVLTSIKIIKIFPRKTGKATDKAGAAGWH